MESNYVCGAFTILFGTVILSLFRPHVAGVQVRPPHAAILGAIASISLNLVTPTEALLVLQKVATSLITIGCLMAITAIGDYFGLMKWLAYRISMASRGNGIRMLFFVFFSGALVGSICTNDSAVLLFMPLVISLLRQSRGPEWLISNDLPYYFAVLYIGNLVGALVISNPINIVVANWFHISFLEYANWMLVPAIVSAAVSFLGLRIAFRRDLPLICKILPPFLPSPMHSLGFRLSTLVLLVMLLGFFSGDFVGIPVWIVAVIGTAMLIAVYVRAQGSLLQIREAVGWDVMVFVSGFLIIAQGLKNAGITSFIKSILIYLGDGNLASLMMATAYVAALCSSVINNHPTAGIMSYVIEELSLPELQSRMVVLSALIGGDLGPKILPIGSIAAMMWFRILRDRGIDVPYWTYIKLGAPITLITILISVTTLAIELILYQFIFHGSIQLRYELPS